MTSCMRGDVVLALGALMTKRRYSLLRARPSSKTTIDATISVPCRLEMS